MSHKSSKIKLELLAVKKASADKKLHPDRIVSWAKAHPKSALHSQFEWNDSAAANSYRIWQARQLIQLHITTEDGTPQMVSLSIDRVKGGGYREIVEVVKDRNLSEVMLKDALAELTRVQLRFQRVKELASVWRELDRVRIRHDVKSRQSFKKAA